MERTDNTVSVGEGIVVDLEIGQAATPEVETHRARCLSPQCLNASVGFLKQMLKLFLLASWCVLMVFSYVSESVVLAGLSVAGLMFSIYFMLLPSLLEYLRADLEASRRKQMANPKVHDEEIVKFEHMCPSSTVDDASIPEDACAVCLVSMDIGEHVRHLSCGHVLHTACLDEWWYAQKGDKMTCPLCRHASCEDMEPKPEQHQAEEGENELATEGSFHL
mmetsp:Transcript_37499/g.81459  ORF Transcript_37499/g.81459 Transcript_37499/m.81459 type:complete len:220 (+) Transcript_37499:215-874(+)